MHPVCSNRALDTIRAFFVFFFAFYHFDIIIPYLLFFFPFGGVFFCAVCEPNNCVVICNRKTPNSFRAHNPLQAFRTTDRWLLHLVVLSYPCAFLSNSCSNCGHLSSITSFVYRSLSAFVSPSSFSQRHFLFVVCHVPPLRLPSRARPLRLRLAVGA